MFIARQIIKLQVLARTGAYRFCSTQSAPDAVIDQNQSDKPKRAFKPRFKKVAIILSGCGVYDGSEITEAVSLLVQLNKLHIDFQCFAPNQNQLHVINHLNGETTTETRNVLVESARIARGEVKDIVELKGEDYQAIILPGGFGAAKNLSDYAVNGPTFTVHEQVTRVLKEFHEQKKPIGAMCISPLLLAKVFQNEKPKITLGKIDNEEQTNKYWPHSSAIQVAESLGAVHQQRNANKFQIDFDNKIVTVPAMMFNGFTKFNMTFQGAGILCQIIEQFVLGNSVNIESFIPNRDRRQSDNSHHNNNAGEEGERRQYQRRTNYGEENQSHSSYQNRRYNNNNNKYTKNEQQE